MFKIGQKVVCIESSTISTINVVKGKTYTVIGYSEWHPQGVMLKEAISNPAEVGFWEHRFRPIDDKWVEELLCKILEEVEQDELVCVGG